VHLNPSSFRYLDWSGGGGSPKVLGWEDFPAMLASADHFARKLPADNPGLLAAIDQAVDGMAARAA
jgi:hypothetical protein